MVRPAGPVVFISSTTEEHLRQYRDAARDASITAGCLPVMMEYFVASGDRLPLVYCLAKVSDADVVVVICAHRHGWVPPDQPGGNHKSITRLECEHAAAEGKEVLAFLVDENATWPEHQREEQAIAIALREGRATPQLLEDIRRKLVALADFKNWLSGRGIRSTFTSAHELEAKVLAALSDWRLRHPDFSELRVTQDSRPPDPRKYLSLLRERTSFIDIRGLSVGSNNAHRFPIDELFISLTTTLATSATGNQARGRAPSPVGPAPRPDAEPMTGSRVPLHNALARPRLAIIGDPSAGKTTFLRYIAHALCRALLDPVPTASVADEAMLEAQVAKAVLGLADRPLPILVRLSDVADHIARSRRSESAPTAVDSSAWIPHLLAAAGHDAHWQLEKEFFRQHLEKGTCLLLMDGLDEAPDRLVRRSLVRLIENLCVDYPQARIVVTSRPPAYRDETVLPGFAQARIDALDDETVQRFLGRWCQALYREHSLQAERHLREMVAALRLPAISRLARNPVMLTALAVVHWNERRLPEQRADLYESVIAWLSRSHEERPGRLRAERSLAILSRRGRSAPCGCRSSRPSRPVSRAREQNQRSTLASQGQRAGWTTLQDELGQGSHERVRQELKFPQRRQDGVPGLVDERPLLQQPRVDVIEVKLGPGRQLDKRALGSRDVLATQIRNQGLSPLKQGLGAGRSAVHGVEACT